MQLWKISAIIKVSKQPESLQAVKRKSAVAMSFRMFVCNPCSMSEIKKETTSMPDQEGNIYRVTELVGTSRTGFDDAVRRAIERAQKTLRHVQWFEVKEQRGRIMADGIEYQVTIEIGFILEG
jgi:flavin-binding protein dodecin